MKRIAKALMVIFATIIMATPVYAEEYGTAPVEYMQIIDGMETYEVDELLRMVWLEARGESIDGQRAVIEVIFNRVLDDEFPNTVHGVLAQRGQFSTYRSLSRATYNQDQMNALSKVYFESPILPDLGYLYFSTSKQRYAHDYIKLGHHWIGR